MKYQRGRERYGKETKNKVTLQWEYFLEQDGENILKEKKECKKSDLKEKASYAVWKTVFYYNKIYIKIQIKNIQINCNFPEFSFLKSYQLKS